MSANGFDLDILVVSRSVSYRKNRIEHHTFNFEKSQKFPIGISMGFLMVSEVTPFPGVTSDTETCLVSPLLLIRSVQKFTKSFL